MERFNRAERIAQRDRLKRNRRGYWGGDLDARRTGMVVQTPHPMSWCACCGNPRHILRQRSFQELCAMQPALHHPDDTYTQEEFLAGSCTPENPCPRCARLTTLPHQTPRTEP